MKTKIIAHQIPASSQQLWLAVLLASVAAHFIAVGGINTNKPTAKPDYTKIAIHVNELPKPTTPPPEPIKPKPKKPEAQKPTPNQQTAKTPTQADTPPVQGLTKDSTSDKGTMSAPVGNTMMTEDTGKRVKDVGQIAGDLSAPATLVRDSIKIPPYTDQALDASLEGTWIVDVFVNVDGSIKDADLRKKIGYGMDERVLTAAKAARFTPRKNKLGVSEPGWAEIKFTLVIP